MIRLLIAVGVPMVGALTVVGTYFGKEIIVSAGWVALSIVGFLFIRPVAGIAVMSTAFLLAAYPTMLQALGSLTINNLLGVCFVVLLGLQVLETRDLSFLRIKQVRILMLIGVLLIIGTFVSGWEFPLLMQSRGKVKIIDKTANMGHDFLARLVFLIFFCFFVRSRADVKVMFLTFMLALFAAVPSALYNLATGTLNRGFRIQASVTSGANPNRLAMICLMEMACWWLWSYARPGTLRKIVALGAMGAAVIVCVGTGSRSGLLGIAVLGLVLQSGPKSYRVPWPLVGTLAVAGAIAIATIVPAESWQRMISFDPSKGQVGASSNVLREGALELGWEMSRDYPLFGVGLGNFREVSRQVYGDDNYRPPHNSYLWAMSEGGIFVLCSYIWLFWATWQDLQIIRRLTVGRDQELLAYANAIRVVFIVYAFFSAFADLWLNPVTYCVLGLVIAMRRYVEQLPALEVAPAAPPAPPAPPLEVGRAVA